MCGGWSDNAIIAVGCPAGVKVVWSWNMSLLQLRWRGSWLLALFSPWLPALLVSRSSRCFSTPSMWVESLSPWNILYCYTVSSSYWEPISTRYKKCLHLEVSHTQPLYFHPLLTPGSCPIKACVTLGCYHWTDAPLLVVWVWPDLPIRYVAGSKHVGQPWMLQERTYLCCIQVYCIMHFIVYIITACCNYVLQRHRLPRLSFEASKTFFLPVFVDTARILVCPT